MEPVNKQSIVVERYYDKENPTKKITVSVSYKIGGMNYLAGRSEPRGYYAHVVPEEINEKVIDGKKITSRIYRGFSGAQQLICETSRYSEARLIGVATQAVKDDFFNKLMGFVITSNNFIPQNYIREL